MNRYRYRRDSSGQEYAVVLIDSDRYGLLEVMIDKADWEHYLAEVNRTIGLRPDLGGLRPVFYCTTGSINRRRISLASWILRAEKQHTGKVIQMKDGNLFNCRRSNMALLSRSEIGHSRTEWDQKADGLPRGVTRSRGRKYQAIIRADGQHWLGTFETSEAAAAACEAARTEHLRRIRSLT